MTTSSLIASNLSSNARSTTRNLLRREIQDAVVNGEDEGYIANLQDMLTFLDNLEV